MVVAAIRCQSPLPSSLLPSRTPNATRIGPFRRLSPNPTLARIAATQQLAAHHNASATSSSCATAQQPLNRKTQNLTPSKDTSPAQSLPLAALLSASPLLLASLLACPAASADVIISMAEDLQPLGYSQASYYTSLALFIISIPGLWSLIKRATKSKIVRRTFQVPGPAAVASSGGKSMAQVAGEITSLLNRNNYRVKEAKEVVTFEGDIAPNRGQAAFLVFCTALSLASVALVLSITNPDIGEWWYAMTLLSPLAGVYYWKQAERTEEIQVKMVISDDKLTADIILQGDDEEIERVRRELNLMEKGLEYVKGIFEA